jgi:Ni,Fe-hydrogenase I small subunit
LLGADIPLDEHGRPKHYYGERVHDLCPRRSAEEAERFGDEELCLQGLGCRGPATYANCPSQFFNGGVNWCIGANAPCIGCTQPTFPGTERFFG